MSTCGATYFQMVNGTISPPILDETILRGLSELCESRQIACIRSSLLLFRTFLLSLTITIVKSNIAQNDVFTKLYVTSLEN